MLVSSYFFNLLCALYFPVFLSLACTVSAPVSTSVKLGEEARFSCAEEAYLILWTIDNINTDLLGIKPTFKEVDGILRSNLTLTGTVENNNVSIQCWVVYLDAPPLQLPPVFLTVLGKS